MKKILFITYDLGVGGAQQHLILFANFLSNNGWHVTIVNLSNNDELRYRLATKVVIINLPRTRRFDFSRQKQIAAIAEEQNIKTVFCNGLYSYLFTKSINSNPAYKISVIFHITTYRNKYEYIKDLAARFLLKPHIKLIGIAKNQIDHLSRVFFIDANRFRLVYNGIQVASFNPALKQSYDVDALRKSLNIAPSTFVIIKVARFDEEKNHEMAIEVARTLKESYQLNFAMIFVGGNNEQRLDKIKNMATQYGVDHYIRYAGVQNDVKPFLAISDVFILTSKSVETFSLAALEAMSMGLPCVLTDLGGANEMISDNLNGYTVAVNNSKEFAGKIADIYNLSLIHI